MGFEEPGYLRDYFNHDFASDLSVQLGLVNNAHRCFSEYGRNSTIHWTTRESGFIVNQHKWDVFQKDYKLHRLIILNGKTRQWAIWLPTKEEIAECVYIQQDGNLLCFPPDLEWNHVDSYDWNAVKKRRRDNEKES